VLASYMGQIVLVVEAGRTPKAAVSDVSTIDGTADMIGMVLATNRQQHGRIWLLRLWIRLRAWTYGETAL
jgi:hypothetical protein